MWGFFDKVTKIFSITDSDDGTVYPIGGEGTPGLGPSAKFGDVDGGDYSEIETDGTLKFNGDASTWDDLQIAISNVKLPPSQAPDWEYYAFGIGSGVTFPTLAFDVGEYVYFDVQTCIL